MIERFLIAVFTLSIAAMLFAAFGWPLLIDTNLAGRALRIVCQAAFAGYVVSMLGRLALRLSARRNPGASD